MSNIEDAMAACRRHMDAAGAKVKAANSADPKDIKALAQLLRDTAETLDGGEISLGHFKANWAFEFSQQMEAKAALKLESESESKTAKLKKIKNVMAAIQSGHLNTVMAISQHYAQHAYVDDIEDID